MIRYLIALTKIQKNRLLIAIFMMVAAVGLSVTFSLERKYISTTTFLTPQPQGTAASAMAQLGALAGGIGQLAGVKSADEMYAALLRTRTVQSEVVASHRLVQAYGVTRPAEARDILNRNTKIALDKKSGMITIAVEDLDSARASEIANSYVRILRRKLDEFAGNEARSRRKYFESEYGKAQGELDEADALFRSVAAKRGISSAQVVMESGVRAGVALRERLMQKEAELVVERRALGPENNQLRIRQAEISAIQAQLKKIEAGGSRSQDELTNQAVQAYRELKVKEFVLEVVGRQLELARMDEAREGPVLQVVEEAVPADVPEWPKRKYLVLLSLATALASACFVSFVMPISKRG